tara:strand:+ start:183 stop:482 length:300 start_codon:yes stop_codon:yes gene_type:complete
MPTIRKPYLDFVYGKSWPSKCGYGKTACSSRFHTDVFVFYTKDVDGNVIETGKLGDVVKHRFVIKGGEYQVLNSGASKKRMSGNKLETITGILPPKKIC